MKTLTLNAWGFDHKISFHLATYTTTGNLYVGLICHDEEYPEHWSDLTVNLDETLEQNHSYIDTNNNGNEIMNWLIANNLGKYTYGMGFSGFCVYPEFEFNMDELMKYVSCDDREV